MNSHAKIAAMNPWVIAVPAVAAAGTGVGAWGAMYPGAQLFGPTVRRTGRPSTLALTFDDGPNPTVTPRLLDLLAQYEARATFFLIGRFAQACPELVREIAARGHTLGNHTHTHPNLIWLSPAQIDAELTRCQESVAGAIGGGTPRWMRPPYGFRGPQLQSAVRRRGFRGVVMWSTIAFDWKPQPASRLIARLERVLPRARGPSGEILLLHDGDHRGLGGDRHHVVSALEFWLPRWRDAGLEFVTMDDVSGPGTGKK
jgi:peptidoglycan/xylan/chitin deacetylase (PgdA/CDA1 family)